MSTGHSSAMESDELTPCCVIVGAGGGLGLSLARRFALGGFPIALISRSANNVDGLSASLNSDGFSARGFVADAAVPRQLESAFDQIKQWGGDIGVLIYNAAAMIPDDVLELTPDAVTDAMALNLSGAICSVNQAVPLMRARGSGTVIITGGGLGIEPYPNWASLSIGKAALRSYTIALHKALAPDNIHVAVVAVCGIVEPAGHFDPGLIAEEYWRLHAETKPNWRRELVYLPEGEDPYYNDPDGVYRTTSLAIEPGA
ncbi:MAG: SDR family NAD(P)-dependent oxidoreductase [Pseudomonadota bacterium]